MWGRYIESELSQAVKKAKTDQQAKQKAKAVMVRVFRDPEAEQEGEAQTSSGSFQDPAKRFGKK